MAAVELSYDRDWARFRVSGMYQSGDGNANNGHATGFDGILDNQENYYRVQVSNGKLEPVFSLKGFQAADSAFGNWSGLAPDESPLVVRDASIQEIYSLDWDHP